MQEGDDKRYMKTVVTLKHFAGYSLEEADGVTRYDFNAVISMKGVFGLLVFCVCFPCYFSPFLFASN